MVHPIFDGRTEQRWTVISNGTSSVFLVRTEVPNVRIMKGVSGTRLFVLLMCWLKQYEFYVYLNGLYSHSLTQIDSITITSS